MIMSASKRRGWGEGGIYQRADGRWVASLEGHSDGKRRRHVFYGKTRPEVIAKRKAALSRLEAHEPIKDAKITVAAMVADYLAKALPASSRKASTIENYGFIARKHLAPAPFGAITLDRLSPSDLEALLVSKRDAGYSDSTVRLIYTVCRGVLEIAVRDGSIRRNIAALVKRPGIRRRDANYLSAEEAGQLLAAAKGDRLYALITLLLGTGVRRGEALALHWEDVDLVAGVMRVRLSLGRVGRQLVFDEVKNRKARFVSLPAPIVEVLRRHKAAMAAERLAAPIWQPWEGHEDLVFPSATGTPQEPRNALRHFVGIAEKAELSQTTLHTLRHSTASALIISGTHMKVIQELLGHSSYSITADIYSHVAVEQQREAAEQLGKAFAWGGES
jgi:integrase